MTKCLCFPQEPALLGLPPSGRLHGEQNPSGAEEEQSWFIQMLRDAQLWVYGLQSQGRSWDSTVTGMFKPILILEARCWEVTGPPFLQHKHCLTGSSMG